MASFSDPVNVHEQHREIIAEAADKITSRNFSSKNSAINALMQILDSGIINSYHKAQSLALLATHSDPDDVDVGDCAMQCIQECRRVINQEGITWMSCARQPWDDLVHAAEAVLARIEAEQEQIRDYQGALRRIQAGVEDSDGEEEHVEQGEGGEQAVAQGEDAVAEGEQAVEGDDDGNKENMEVELYQSQDNNFDADINQALDQALNEHDFAVADSAGVHIGISMEVFPSSYTHDDEPADFECTVDPEDCCVIEVFLLLLVKYGAECRHDMERMLEQYTQEKSIGSELLLNQMVSGLEGLVIRTKPKEDHSGGNATQTT